MKNKKDIRKKKIIIKGIKKYLSGKQVHDGVDLDIYEGETIVIIGGSGTGKSVLLKSICGLMEADEGSITIDGQEIVGISEKKLNEIMIKFGVLFQGAALFDSLTVFENVGFALSRLTKKTKEEISRIAEDKLSQVGLKGIGDMKPAELSGGMKKRVGLARAVAMDPEIILYDEPTTGLDPIMADVINELIIRMSKTLNVTSIVVTHDMVSAYKVADRIAMLYEGKIIGYGTPDEIKNTDNPIIRQFIEGQAEGPIKVL
jgi:phospholipid/cholesterol/gamma-HCH transport system ATP-binding protein